MVFCCWGRGVRDIFGGVLRQDLTRDQSAKLHEKPFIFHAGKLYCTH